MFGSVSGEVEETYVFALASRNNSPAEQKTDAVTQSVKHGSRLSPSLSLSFD